MTIEPNIAFLATYGSDQEINLERVAESVMESGFAIDHFQVGGGPNPVTRWSQPLSFAKDELRLAYDKRQLSFVARHQDGLLELRFHLNWWKEPILDQTRFHAGVVSFQSALFNGPDSAEYSARLLDLGGVLYACVRPSFGWADTCEPAGYTWFQHADALSVPYLYWANFWGPKYVQKIGREELLTAPFWQVRQLSDGGLLCVVSPVIGREMANQPTRAILDSLSLDDDT